MKKAILFSFFCFLSLLGICQEVPVPDFTNRPYILTNEGELISFERAIANIDYKIKGLGYGGSEAYYTINPNRSDIRFNLGELPRFIIRTEENQDPSEVIYFSKADTDKKRRRFIAGKYSMLGKSKSVETQFIELAFKKIGENLFEIEIVDLIGNGEFAFIPFDTGEAAANMNSKLFINCIGID